MKKLSRYLCLVFSIVCTALLFKTLFLGVPVITVRNLGTSTISQVHLVGAGFHSVIDSLPAGESRILLIRPDRDSDLTITWVSQDRPYQENLLVNLDLGRFGGECLNLNLNDDKLLFDGYDLYRPCFSTERIV